MGAKECDEEGRGGVGFSGAFEGHDLEAVGESEVGDIESAFEAEGVEEFPRLRGGDGDARCVCGVGDGARVGVGVEVGVLLDPGLAAVVGEPVEAYVELSFELVGLVLGVYAELVELVVFV